MKAKGFKTWSGRADLNRRPLAPKASALPGCATSRRYEHSTLSEHPAVAQLLDDEPYRLPAVADPVLLLGGVLGHRLPGPLDEKDRVVPETGRSARDGHDLPFDTPGALRNHPGGEGGGGGAEERSRPRPRKGFQFVEKHSVVLLVGRLLARVPGGSDARPAGHRVHRQPGVVRDAEDIARLRVMKRLAPRVLRECFSRFARLRYARHVGQRQDLDVPLQPQPQQHLDLVDLSPVAGSDQQFHRFRLIHSFWRARMRFPARTDASSIPSSSPLVNGFPSAVPCTSLRFPLPVMTTFMSTSAAESSA